MTAAKPSIDLPLPRIDFLPAELRLRDLSPVDLSPVDLPQRDLPPMVSPAGAAAS